MRCATFACVVSLVIACVSLVAAPASPSEITVTVPTRLELTRGDKPAGSVGLAVGEKLALIDEGEVHALVRYRGLVGWVAVAQTDLPRRKSRAAPSPLPPAATSAAAPAAATVGSAPAGDAPPKTQAKAVPPPLPANALERALAGKLVWLEKGELRPFDAARLAGVRFYAIYFSASWCPPCRAFTPDFIDAYGKIRALYPEFEVVLVDRDRSPGEMLAYMREDHMPWPALRWDAIRGTSDITRYAGNGIPCLVLVDEDGKVLSDSYRWFRYVGPDAVLDDTWRILRDYRRKNPRPKS